MGYRDELGAARERIAALESDLAAEQERGRQLESALKGRAPLAPSPLQSAGPRFNLMEPRAPGGSLRRVHYHRPRTYFPMARLAAAAARAAWRRAPDAKPRSIETESVIRWALEFLRVPAVYLLWLPIYWLTFCAVFPIALLFCVLLTPFLIPIVAVSRLSFASEPPATESGWFHGDGGDSAGASLLFAAAILLAPASLPFIISLEVGE